MLTISQKVPYVGLDASCRRLLPPRWTPKPHWTRQDRSCTDCFWCVVFPFIASSRRPNLLKLSRYLWRWRHRVLTIQRYKVKSLHSPSTFRNIQLMIVPFSERTRSSKTIFAHTGFITQPTRSLSHCGRTISPPHQKDRHLTEGAWILIVLTLSSVDWLRSKVTWYSKVLGGPSPKHFPREDKKLGSTVRWSNKCFYLFN